MQDVRHILVPTDGSPDSLAAASFAGDLARALAAQVTVLTVLDDRLVVQQAWNAALAPVPEQPDSVAEARASMEQRARDSELAETRSSLGKLDQEVELVQRWGHPSSEICNYAKDNDVDLIVMGSHGRSGIKRVLLGSVSHAVTNEAPCAVTIVR